MSEHLIYCIEAIIKNTGNPGNPTGLFIGYCGEKVSRMATYERAYKFHDKKTANAFKEIYLDWANLIHNSQPTLDFKITEHEEITEVAI